MQTCIGLAVVRNIAYYTNFWSLMAVCWTLVFILSPFQNKLVPAFHWACAKSLSVRKVCDQLPRCRLQPGCTCDVVMSKYAQAPAKQGLLYAMSAVCI